MNYSEQKCKNCRGGWYRGIDPGDVRICLQVVGVVKCIKGFQIRGLILIIPVCGETSTMSPPVKPETSQWPVVAGGRWGWRLHTLRGGVDPGDARFRRRVVGVVGV